MADTTNEVNLQDVLRARVASGEPVYVIGNPDSEVLDAIVQGAKQAARAYGGQARVIQVVGLPELPASPQPSK